MLPEEAARFRIAHAIRDALPTRVHAEMLFEQAADLIGIGARVERSGDGSRLKLFRTGPLDLEQIAPWPLLELDLRGRLDFVISPDGEPMEIPTRPGGRPKGRGMGPGQLNIHANGDEISLVYGTDGRCSEIVNARRPEWFEEAEKALVAKTGSPVDLLAGFVASLKPGRGTNHGGLYVPAPFPQGLQGLWNLGRRHLARALFENRLPEDACCSAADALSGDAVAMGDTRVDAVRAVRAEIDRLRPWLPREEAPFAMSDEEAANLGAVVLRTPAVDVPMPPRDPANVPIAVVTGFPRQDDRPRFGEWRRFVSASGYTRWHYFRPEDDGWSVFGLDLEVTRGVEWIRNQVRAADARLDANPRPVPPWPDTLPPLRMYVRTYDVVFAGTFESGKLEAGEAWVHDLHPWDLDADVIARQVVRMRWIKE